MSSVPPWKVLIIDDHSFQRVYLCELFSSAGVWDLQTAKNGEEALQLLEHQTFSLILSDLMMPGLDGVQLIQRLAELGNQTPLALMTASPRRMMMNVANVARMLGIEVVGQIFKPAAPEAIRRLLERLGSFHHLRRREALPCKRGFDRHQLESALAKGQIQAWFQPKQHLASNRVFSAEALVRWSHPELGVLLPGDFLADLECAGLEQALLFHMLEQAVQAQAEWLAQGFRIKISVNLPSHLLEIPDLPDQLYSRVRELGGRTRAISLELTENSMTSQASHFHAAACRLRMMGFGLSLDDFGIGYSSFSKWLNTPFTEIKIDRSLILDCAQDSVIESALVSIIALARQMDMEVVAEGVENDRQLALLRCLECDYVQGFLIAPALSRQIFLEQLQGRFGAD